jgi:hypothetical protein
MTWEYLYDFDDRERIIGMYLEDWMNWDTNIVDLNCMHDPLLNYISPTFNSYRGNDIQDVFPKPTLISPMYGVKFFQITDEEMARITKLCDILVVMGYGGYEKTKEEAESKTLRKSINKIITKTKPGLVVLEGIQEFGDLLNLNEFPKYKLVKEIAINGNSRVFKRIIKFYES